jgi:hypothetical protein
MQSKPETEWPRHPDTGCVGCQDACRRGARCPEPLEKLESFEEEGRGICEDCREWVAVEKEDESVENGTEAGKEGDEEGKGGREKKRAEEKER